MQLLRQRKYFFFCSSKQSASNELHSMAKLEMLGAPFTQIDCTSALPKSLLKRSATQSYGRSIINSLTLGRLSAA
jgi:hypothetical protein